MQAACVQTISTAWVCAVNSLPFGAVLDNPSICYLMTAFGPLLYFWEQVTAEAVAGSAPRHFVSLPNSN